MNACNDINFFDVELFVPVSSSPTTRTIHSRHIIDLLAPLITGPAVDLGDSDVVHVLLLNPKNSTACGFIKSRESDIEQYSDIIGLKYAA